MRAVLIPAEGDPREVDVADGADHYQAVRDLIGGPIEGLGVGREDAHAFGHDEAKLINLPANSVASALIYGEKEAARERGRDALARYAEMGFEIIDGTGDDPREPFIAGDVLVLGIDDAGASTAIPDDLAASILGDRS